MPFSKAAFLHNLQIFTNKYTFYKFWFFRKNASKYVRIYATNRSILPSFQSCDKKESTPQGA